MSVVSKTKDISSYFAKGKAAQAMSGVIESAIAATGADAGSRAKRGVTNSASSPAEPNLKKAKKSEPEAASASTNTSLDEVKVADPGLQQLPALSAAEVTYENMHRTLPASWHSVLAPEFTKSYYREMVSFLVKEEASGAKIFPPRHLTYNAFIHCPFDQVRVVIIGQDPYHNPGEAMGLCFSVPKGVKVPSSLQNIYKELGTDLAGQFKHPGHGDLTGWANQGVLLLNTALTVKAHTPASHSNKGWPTFTDTVISRLSSAHDKPVVFILWGKHAQSKAKLINKQKHHILESAHPSGLSASRGFYGCKHFSKTNALLAKAGLPVVNWGQL